MRESVLPRAPKPSWMHPSSEQRASSLHKGTGTEGEHPHQNPWGPQKAGVTSRPVPEESQDRTTAATSGQEGAHGAARANPVPPSTGTTSSFSTLAEIPTVNPHSPRPHTLPQPRLPLQSPLGASPGIAPQGVNTNTSPLKIQSPGIIS